ncbi:MAG TPA: ATP-binding protein [Stellaceae bacterium]|jgi:anti-sigma regulatory factor (Ser/Thr protein kinase)|nr:ATP-binding protein [Stellaceae bacterium]
MASHELCIEPHVPEITRLIDWIESCCGSDGLAEDITYKMTLALEEAVMNVISHAFEGIPPPYRITVRLSVMPQTVMAEIIDNGRPFDPTAAPDPNLTIPLDERHPGGLGIHLMRSVTDRLDYHRSSDGNNVLRMEKARG